jgi:hypothetical protein
MTKLMKLALFVFLCATCWEAEAQTVSATSCGSSDVQTAINNATEGQTVTIPAGKCTWTSGVTISGKGITVSGSGAGRIIAYSSDTLSIGTGSKSINVTSTLVSGSLSISNGQTLTVSETGNRQNFMTGTVSGYSSGALTMKITSTGGSCGNSSSGQSPSNCKRWLVSTQPSTVIVNNVASGGSVFRVTEDSKVHTTLSGFKIAAGTGGATGVAFISGGGAAIVLQNCWIEQNSASSDAVNTGANRGVISNCSFDSTPFSMAPLAVHLQPYDTAAWSKASYWGTADTTGQNNLYVETSDFHAYLNATDNDEGARSVFRYSLFNNAGFGTHGADTGPIGQRYFEFYNNKGVYNGYNDGTTFPMNWWFFVRGGTFLIHDNALPALVSTDYGTKSDVNMTVMNLQRNAGPAPCWGAGTSGGADYFASHQVGLGYVTGNGTNGLKQSNYSTGSYGFGNQYVGDPEPAYIWNNSRTPLGNVGTSDYGSSDCSNPDTSANYIRQNRDYYNGTSAKPGYAPYTYPHPLLQSSSQTSPPPAPLNLNSVVK